VELCHDNAARPLGETFDAVLFSPGVTHLHDAWLDALAPGRRMVLPFTVAMPVTGPFGPAPFPASAGPMSTIGKGPVVAIGRSADGAAWDAGAAR
jgi:hypothetical protein